MPTTVDRLLPTEEAEALLELTRELATKELAPQVAEAEEKGEFPAAAYALLGKSGLLSLPFSEEQGGGGPAVRGVPPGRRGGRRGVAERGGRDERAHADGLRGRRQREPRAVRDLAAADARRRLARRLLPVRAAGRLRRQRDQDEGAPSTGTRTSSPAPSSGSATAPAPTTTSSSPAPGDDPTRGLSAFIVPADTPGMSFGAPEKKMGLACDVTTQVLFDEARIPADQRIGEEGDGMKVALSALDSGRLGIAAVATGLAQGALAHAVEYARERQPVRQDDRRVPGAAVPARRARRRGGAVPRDVPARRPAQGRRPAVLPPGQHRQADRHRRRDARQPPTPCRCSAATATPATTPSSGTSATPRSPRSSRAPTRSSGWSSGATCSSDQSDPLLTTNPCCKPLATTTRPLLGSGSAD